MGYPVAYRNGNTPYGNTAPRSGGFQSPITRGPQPLPTPANDPGPARSPRGPAWTPDRAARQWPIRQLPGSTMGMRLGARFVPLLGWLILGYELYRWWNQGQLAGTFNVVGGCGQYGSALKGGNQLPCGGSFFADVTIPSWTQVPAPTPFQTYRALADIRYVDPTHVSYKLVGNFIIPAGGGKIAQVPYPELLQPETSPLAKPKFPPYAMPWFFPALDPLSLPPMQPAPQPLPLPYPMLPHMKPNPFRAPSERTQWGPEPVKPVGRPFPQLKPHPVTGVPRLPIELFPPVPTPRTAPRLTPRGGPQVVLEPGRPARLPRSGERIRDKPPEKDEKEKKLNLSLKGTKVGTVVNLVTEFGDFTQALYDALPCDTICGEKTRHWDAKHKRWKYHNPNFVKRHKILWRDFDKIDWPTALLNLVDNDAEDTSAGHAGRINAGANKRLGRAAQGPGTVQGRISRMTRPEKGPFKSEPRCKCTK